MSATPAPARPQVRESIVLIPTCPNCKRQETHAPTCDHQGHMNAVYRRSDTFLRFDTNPLAPVTTLKFSYSNEPTNWQASPDGRTIRYFDTTQRNAEGWMFLKLLVEGVGK